MTRRADDYSGTIAERNRELEQELGLYEPAGDNLSECPRCGGVSVLTHDPRDYTDRAVVCARCAIEVLGVTDPDYRWKLWECCQTRDPQPRFCMSGCTHMTKRREATFQYRQQERNAEVSAQSNQERGSA